MKMTSIKQKLPKKFNVSLTVHVSGGKMKLIGKPKLKLR